MVTPEVADYLRSTTIVQWQQKKMLFSLDQVDTAARSKNLRFGPSEAVNSDDYVVHAVDGRLLRRGSLTAIRHFIEQY